MNNMGQQDMMGNQYQMINNILQQQQIMIQMMNNMMNQQQMMQANMNNNTQVSNQNMGNADQLNVFFRQGGSNANNQAPIMIQCRPEDKVSEIIERYRNKANDRDLSKKFIFNAKALAHSLKLSEAGITNNANIFVVTTQGIKVA